MFKAFFEDMDHEITDTLAQVQDKVADYTSLESFVHTSDYEDKMATRNTQSIILNLIFNPDYADSMSKDQR